MGKEIRMESLKEKFGYGGVLVEGIIKEIDCYYDNKFGLSMVDIINMLDDDYYYRMFKFLEYEKKVNINDVVNLLEIVLNDIKWGIKRSEDKS